MSPFRIFFRSGLYVTLSSTPVFKFVVKIYIFVEQISLFEFLLFYTVSPFLGVGVGVGVGWGCGRGGRKGATHARMPPGYLRVGGAVTGKLGWVVAMGRGRREEGWWRPAVRAPGLQDRRGRPPPSSGASSARRSRFRCHPPSHRDHLLGPC